VMSVNPGWGGRPFVERSMKKLTAARRLRGETGARFVTKVDCGIKPLTAAAAAAGADVLVGGSAIFESPDSARPSARCAAAETAGFDGPPALLFGSTMNRFGSFSKSL